MLTTLPALIQPVSGDALRAVMRHVPTPVTVMTTAVAGEIHGVTIGSFTSVSLDPPLVSFNIQQHTTLHDVYIRVGQSFAVNVLSEEQAYLSDHFSIPDRAGTSHFGGLAYDLTEEGLPLLEGSVAHLVCEVAAFHSAGDHSLVIGLVKAVREGQEERPLVYYKRMYHTITA